MSLVYIYIYVYVYVYIYCVDVSVCLCVTGNNAEAQIVPIVLIRMALGTRWPKPSRGLCDAYIDI